MNKTLKNLACVAVILAALTVVGHELAGRAEAQSGSQDVTGFASDGYSTYVIVTGGDVFRQRATGAGGTFTGPPEYVGNYWTGTGPTTVTPQTWSQIKGAHGPE